MTYNRLFSKQVSIKERLANAQSKLKKIKEDEATPAQVDAIIDEIDQIVVDAVEELGSANPAVDALIDTAKELEVQSDIAEITEADEEGDSEDDEEILAEEDEKKDDEEEKDDEKDDEKKEESSSYVRKFPKK
jgi:hypothetical protein